MYNMHYRYLACSTITFNGQWNISCCNDHQFLNMYVDYPISLSELKIEQRSALNAEICRSISRILGTIPPIT